MKSHLLGNAKNDWGKAVLKKAELMEEDYLGYEEWIDSFQMELKMLQTNLRSKVDSSSIGGSTMNAEIKTASSVESLSVESVLVPGKDSKNDIEKQASNSRFT